MGRAPVNLLNYLLDTHIWLWWLAFPGKIVPSVVDVIRDPETELWLSAISVWELFTLVRKRRYTANPCPEIWLEHAFEILPLREAPLTIGIIKIMNQVEMPHRDPADWLIAATARHLNATLITSDTQLAKTKGIKVLLNQ